MARHKFNLDEQILDSYMVLIHGGRGAGKTDLLGDMLKYEKQHGPVRLINVKGEDGTLTLKGRGIGDCAETIDNYEDFEGAITEYVTHGGIQAVGVDSLWALVRWVMLKVVGTDRLPTITKSGPNEWGELHRKMDNLMMMLRRSAKYVMATCPSDRSVDQLTQVTYITPDLPGRQAVGIAGAFDFVAYLKSDVRLDGSGVRGVQRTLTLAPSSLILTRQRVPKQIVDDITLPTGPGGWKLLKDAIEGAWK